MLTVNLGKDQYLVYPRAQATVTCATCSWEPHPILVLSTPDGFLSRETLVAELGRFLREDDVFSLAFLSSSVILQIPRGRSVDQKKLLRTFQLVGSDFNTTWSVDELLFLQTDSPDEALPDGPYFIAGNKLYEAWRIFPDPLDSFQTSVVPASSKESSPYEFSALSASSIDGQWKAVAVPSRLYFQASDEKPLAGLRISVKDNFKIKGIRTTLACRSFYETYEPEVETADYLKVLIDKGAILVGKTKMNAFASSEDPPLDTIDYSCPFNPRGDGYQQPLGSTTGGATALAGYDWLDISLGTDTRGSVRAPAAHNGMFGIRLSTNISVSIKGIYHNTPQFDVVGILARSLNKLKLLAKHSLQPCISDVIEFPKRILYPLDFFPQHPPYQDIVEEYVSKLEEFLDVSRTVFRISDRWDAAPPKEANGRTIQDFLNKTASNPDFYDSYHQYDEFRAKHFDMFGRPVYLSPYMTFKWGQGQKVAPEEKQQSLNDMEIFRRWFAQNVLAQDNETASNAVMILPSGIGKPWYRDVPFENKMPSVGWSSMAVATLLALPQIVLPFGQIAYNSRITNRTEYLPVATSMVAASGSDLMLMNLAQSTLRYAQWPSEVKTGSLMFDLPTNESPNIRNVAKLGDGYEACWVDQQPVQAVGSFSSANGHS